MRIKQLIAAALLLAAPQVAHAQQVDWDRFERMVGNGEYKSAYAQAKSVYDRSGDPNERFAAAFCMTTAAVRYQEDAIDSAVVRYRALLPSLDSLHQALCYAFLGSYDTALAYESVLKRTPVYWIRNFCDPDGGDRDRNMTPTAYDVLVLKAVAVSDDAREKISLQQKLVDFHKGDGDELRIWHDRQLLFWMKHAPNVEVTLETYQGYIDKYRDSKCKERTWFYYNAATFCTAKADNVKAVAYCDTAVAIAKDSEGGSMCYNLRASIKHPQIDVVGDMTVMPGQPALGTVTYRNIGHAWFRIIPYQNHDSRGDEARKRLLAAKPIHQWDVELPANSEYRYDKANFTLPALKAGKYILLVSSSEDFKKHGFRSHQLDCTEMALLKDHQAGILFDRGTGRPIAGQEVRLELNGKETKLLETQTTDRNGRYRFNCTEDTYRHQIVIERNGYRLVTNYGVKHAWEQDTTVEVTLCFDRPIYKPGDTVHVAALCFATDGYDARALAGHALELELKDPNYGKVTVDSVVTDDFGVATACFVLPKDRLAGRWYVAVRDTSGQQALESLRVEEYKQPKFMVEFGTGNDRQDSASAPAFGVPCTVRGMAASYSAVPVSGARVQYTVVRRQIHRFWWRQMYTYRDTEVAKGEVTTTADGSFEVTFTPEPDSNVELSTKPCFEYVVSVDVTDINGESHPATYKMRVGYRNAFIRVLSTGTDVRSLDGFEATLMDLNGKPLPGKVDVKIERLRQPAVPLLSTSYPEARQTMGEEDYRKAFPLLAYDKDHNDMDKWPVASDRWTPGQAGVYRITLTAEGADTIVEYRTVTPDGCRKAQSQQLLWADVDKEIAEVGGNVTLRFGSRFKNVEVYYMLNAYGTERDFRRVHLSDELHTISIPVDSTMLGGFDIALFTIRDNHPVYWKYYVSVPFTHKKLDMEISTFRDKLVPGETEEWTIKVKGERLSAEPTPQQEVKEPAALVMTMYDDALNSYQSMGWGFSPWRENWYDDFDYVRFYSHHGWFQKEAEIYRYSPEYPVVWNLKYIIPQTKYNRKHRMAGNSVAGFVGGTGYAEAEEAVFSIVENKVPVIEVGAPESGMRIAADDLEYMSGSTDERLAAKASAAGCKNSGEDPQVQVRRNQGTLAFFLANLRTDSTGTATCRFTVPELLTRWNIKGLAITKDIKTGTLDKTLVTSKPLMVQPNMPRFLRSGDSLALMAKIVKSDDADKAEPVAVSFLLTDAATGDTLCRQRQHLLVAGAAQVVFDVEVPRNVYVANYEIVAVADGESQATRASDGERGQLPVVSNRQAVTVSQAVYINGAGEKHYRMPEVLVSSDTRVPRLVAAEVTSNPVWLAVKSMPYLKLQESPSTIYLSNQYFMNTLGRKLLNDLDGLKDLAALGEGAVSRLSVNSDVKQTLLQATPWVQDAVGEQDQMAAVANYFNPEELNRTIELAVKELQRRQNADGGWSWMPDGQSSVWVTQQVLKNIDRERFNVDGALDYIDREHQRDYEKYIKHHLTKRSLGGVADIDYLYTRSLYGKGKTEAYRYHYSNALKTYKEYDNLYTQAQLALVFHRHGDRKAALDLLHRLKQKSLESDEMGGKANDLALSGRLSAARLNKRPAPRSGTSRLHPNSQFTIHLRSPN